MVLTEAMQLILAMTDTCIIRNLSSLSNDYVIEYFIVLHNRAYVYTVPDYRKGRGLGPPNFKGPKISRNIFKNIS